MSAVKDRFSLVPIEALYDDRLTNAEYRMLSVLYSFRDKSCNTVWPRLESIQERAGYANKTLVSRMTTKLESKGWLRKGKKKGPRGPKVYELTVPEHIKLDREGQVDQGGQVDPVDPQETEPDGQVDQGGQVDFPEHKPEAKLPVAGNSQLDRGGQLSYEHTRVNKPINQQTSSDPIGSAAFAANPVDNSFDAIGRDYQNPSAEKLIFDRGAYFFGLYGIEEQAARKFLGMCKSRVGTNRTLDAVVVSILSQPTGDPKAFMLQVVANQPRPLTNAWQPPDATLVELNAMSIPVDLVIQARDVFVTWFMGLEIQHSDWPRLFRDWCVRQFEAAERQAYEFRRRLAQSVGMNYEPAFQEAHDRYRTQN